MVIRNVIDAIEVPRNMLILTGVWPYKEEVSCFYRLKIYFIYIFTAALISTMTLEVVLSSEDIFNLSDILFIYFEYLAYILQLITFRSNIPKVLSLQKKLEDPQLNLFEDHHNKYIKNAIGRVNFIGNAFKCSGAFTVFFFALRPFIEDRVFPIPFSFFNEGFLWFIIYFMQIIALAIGVWNHSAMDTLCVGYIGIALVELDVLLDRLSNFGISRETRMKRSDVEAEEYLRRCYEHHNKIIIFVRNIEDVFTKAILAQYFCSAIVICNSGFHLLITPLGSTKFLSLIVFFSTIMIELAMFCWFGNEVILKSLEIGNACYMSIWYQYGSRINKIIFTIMERSKRPLTISAYKYSVLSLSAYITIIQWSYSYFTVLRRLYMKT